MRNGILVVCLTACGQSHGAGVMVTDLDVSRDVIAVDTAIGNLPLD